MSKLNMEKEDWLKKIEGIVDEERENILKKAEPRLRELLIGVPVKVFWGEGNNLYGDYYGTPYPKNTPLHSFSYPSDINIYAASFQRFEDNEKALKDKIKIVLIHEYGHFLGLKENELREKGIY